MSGLADEFLEDLEDLEDSDEQAEPVRDNLKRDREAAFASSAKNSKKKHEKSTKKSRENDEDEESSGDDDDGGEGGREEEEEEGNFEDMPDNIDDFRSSGQLVSLLTSKVATSIGSLRRENAFLREISAIREAVSKPFEPTTAVG